MKEAKARLREALKNPSHNTQARVGSPDRRKKKTKKKKGALSRLAGEYHVNYDEFGAAIYHLPWKNTLYLLSANGLLTAST